MENLFTIVYSSLAILFLLVVGAIGYDVYRDMKSEFDRNKEESDNVDDKSAKL